MPHKETRQALKALWAQKKPVTAVYMDATQYAHVRQAGDYILLV